MLRDAGESEETGVADLSAKVKTHWSGPIKFAQSVLMRGRMRPSRPPPKEERKEGKRESGKAQGTLKNHFVGKKAQEHASWEPSAFHTAAARKRNGKENSKEGNYRKTPIGRPDGIGILIWQMIRLKKADHVGGSRQGRRKTERRKGLRRHPKIKR